MKQPGPLHAFYERIRARRGAKIAVVACARKLAVLFWCLLMRGEDYAHSQPSLTATKLRLLEIRSGAPTMKGTDTGTWATRQRMRTARDHMPALCAHCDRAAAEGTVSPAGRRNSFGSSSTP